jgi:3-deoxy-D-manno-octulosonic-acid transferase
MRSIYTWLLRLAVPLASLLVAWRGLRRREYWHGWRERFGFGYAGIPDGLWIHAVSVGEVQAAIVLARALRMQLPSVPLTLTTATPAGRALATQSGELWTQVRFAPYDLPGVQRRVLRLLRPRLLLILETELWPNQLSECARAGLPVLAVSARVAERTVRWLRRWPGLLDAAALGNLTVLAQSAADAARFAALGVPAAQIAVCGNLKFDRKVEVRTRQFGAAMRAELAPDAPLWVAGSTREGEEEAVLQAHRAVLQRNGAAVLVLAPRHRERVPEVIALLERLGFSWRRRSAGAVARTEVLLLDTLGELTGCYAAADLAFVGGSLQPFGGHNLLEPASLGVATLTGPHHASVPDVLRVLRAARAVTVVRDAGELRQAVVRLLFDDSAARRALGAAAQAAVTANRGALAASLSRITARLAPSPAPAVPSPA